nr:leucine-rich repeat domain-containing protein [uncultured Prevotella sp.]
MLVVLMLMTTSRAMAQEAKFEVIDGFRYLLESDTKTATLVPQKDGDYSGDIIIVPEKVKGNDGVEYVVTSLGASCFKGCSGLTSITIPSSVTSLGDYCFYGCRGLTSITIPSSVTSLGDYCFDGCRGLTSITIPSSVTSLDDYCFQGCSGLTSITIPSSVTSLGYECFMNCSGLTSITIPSSVTSLGDYCFSGCSGLTSITIPSSVTSLGGYCFEGCRGLTSITIPSSVTSLGVQCFYGCRGLTSITIPSSGSYLGWHCFEDCQNLESVYFKGKYNDYVNYPNLKISTTSIIKVPTEYLQGYKHAFGSDYKYIYAWNPNETGEDNKPVTQCSTPSISYETGKLMFACETTGAKYHYTITDTDIKSNALSENGEVSLSAAYNISVYATADGYKASDKAEATLYWINANQDNGTNINMVRIRGVVASAHDGIICLSGLDNGEVVKFYAADGKYLGSSVAANGAASYAVNESLVIAKVGKDSIKIAVK